jgi:hypothetical protein
METAKTIKSKRAMSRSKKITANFIGLAIYLYLSNIHAACEFRAMVGAGECLQTVNEELEPLRAFSLR